MVNKKLQVNKLLISTLIGGKKISSLCSQQQRFFYISNVKIKIKEGKYDCYYGVNMKRGLTFIFNIHIYLITFILTDDRVIKWQYAALTIFFSDPSLFNI